MKKRICVNQRKNINPCSSAVSAFTIMELLIIITLIAVVAAATLALLNPKKQLEKAWDGQRKKELSTLSKILEDWYNDKNRYPLPSEICYANTGDPSCDICGSEGDSPSFSPYLSRLPCDPQHQTRNYLYYTSDPTNPTGYVICAKLSDGTNFTVSSQNMSDINPCSLP